MEQTDRWRARLELEVDSGTLRDLESLEEGKYRIERMGNTVKRCIESSEALLSEILDNEMGRNIPSRADVRGLGASPYYISKNAYVPSHRRFSSYNYQKTKNQTAIPRRHNHPGVRERRPVDGRFQSVAEISEQIRMNHILSSSVDDKIQRIKQQNNRLKAMILTGQIDDLEFLKDEKDKRSEHPHTGAYSSKDEMASHHLRKENEGVLYHDEEPDTCLDDRKERQAVSCEACRNGRRRSQPQMVHVATEHHHACPLCHQLTDTRLSSLHKVSRLSPDHPLVEFEDNHKSTIKKQMVDKDSLVDLVKEQKELILKLSKRLEEPRAADLLFRATPEGSSSFSRSKSKTNNLTIPVKETFQRSLKTEEAEYPNQMSPVFGKFSSPLPKQQEMSFEHSKSHSKNPNSQKIIHFQDGLSRINAKENSYESLQDIQLKIHSLDKIQAQASREDRLTFDRKAPGSTACTAKEAEYTSPLPKADEEPYVILKPHSSREGLKRRPREISSSPQDPKAKQKGKTQKGKASARDSNSKESQRKPVLLAKEPRNASRKKERTPSAVKKTKDAPLSEKKVLKPMKSINLRDLILSQKRQDKSPKGLIHRTLKENLLTAAKKKMPAGRVTNKTTPKPRFEPRTSSVDRMFQSGALYNGSVLKENGFDSFNNGLIAYCFLKRRFAPEYKKQVDNLVSKVEDFLLAKKITQLLKLQNKV
jgi:hypothetical protein